MSATFRPVLALVTSSIALGACSSSPPELGSAADDLTGATSMAYSLAGFEETMLVADADGVIEIVHVGKTSTKAIVGGVAGKPIVAGVSRAHVFHVLTADGKLSTIDIASARVTQSVSTGVANAADLAMDSDGKTAYVSSKSRLLRIDMMTGKLQATLDLSSAVATAGDKVLLGRILRLPDKLLVQVDRSDKRGPVRGAIAVVNGGTLKLERTVELTVKDPTNGPVDGFNPGGPFVVDEASNSIFVTALGSPSSTKGGATMRLNAKTFELAPWALQLGAFQGPVAVGPANASPRFAFTGEHTRTPVSSTHLRVWKVDPSGNLVEPREGTLMDAFQEIESFPMNQARTLFAWPVDCPVGFCVGGVGISFVDTRKAEVFPRLPESDLGLKPSFVLFGQP